MRKILVATHGRFAPGIQDSVRLIAGDAAADSIQVIPAYVDGSDYTSLVRDFVSSVTPEDEAFIFTDLYGGSVNTEIIRQTIETRPDNVYQISGLNLGLLLEIVLNADDVIGREGIEEIIAMARQEITLCPKDEDEAADGTGSGDDFFA